MKFPQQRNRLVYFSQKMQETGLSRGSSGNLSARVEGGFLVTPSAMKPEDYNPEDIVFIALGCDETSPSETSELCFEGTREPSSEWRFHHDIYKKYPDAEAVLHAHSLWATSLACLGDDIPAFHYMIALAGGSSIRCAPYAIFGSEELSANALKALDGRKACLLANHGLLVHENSLENVFELAQDIEELCQQYALALQAGAPKTLSDAQMEEVLERFSAYRKTNQS